MLNETSAQLLFDPQASCWQPIKKNVKGTQCTSCLLLRCTQSMYKKRNRFPFFFCFFFPSSQGDP
jgi:hypothetical protein